ncbi:MAG: hypothetical protein V3U54_08655 [Thermodesulfobacteriota bacterium]
MTEYQEVKEIIDKTTGKRYTFTMTGGGYYEHKGPRGNWSVEARLFGVSPFTEETMIDLYKQYE